ncbi:MAG: SDR family oxidoreductase [bacterium]|nr:SDR family oxidoreductase [bacterium]
MKSILITGCSSGIGRAVAMGLKSRGYQVLATARREEDVRQLSELGFQSHMLDLRQPSSIATAVDWGMNVSNGRIYGLFNNGAYGQPGAVEDLTRDCLREQFETNLFGTHDLTTRLIPQMRQHNEGRIIQNSSLLGFVSLRFRGAYNASKHALEGLTDTMRLELKGTGIHVSILEPGPITSNFRKNALAALERNIDVDKSFFAAGYKATLARLTKEGPAAPGTLPAEACLAPLLHALESTNPKLRYRVTWPSNFFAVMKRILPGRTLDSLLSRVE